LTFAARPRFKRVGRRLERPGPWYGAMYAMRIVSLRRSTGKQLRVHRTRHLAHRVPGMLRRRVLADLPAPTLQALEELALEIGLDRVGQVRGIGGPAPPPRPARDRVFAQRSPLRSADRHAN